MLCVVYVICMVELISKTAVCGDPARAFVYTLVLFPQDNRPPCICICIGVQFGTRLIFWMKFAVKWWSTTANVIFPDLSVVMRIKAVLSASAVCPGVLTLIETDSRCLKGESKKYM